MRNCKILVALIFCGCLFANCSSTKQTATNNQYVYVPDDKELYDTIVKLDSTFFHLYNTCNINLQQYADFYSDSIEFFHDKGGLSTSKKDIVDGTKKNICGKVTRELVPGSIEVYPIKGYGAIEMGLHKFHNNQDPESAKSRAGKFVIIWQHKNSEWKITKVISLH